MIDSSTPFSGSVASDVASTRNDLPLALEYGRIETISVTPLHKYKPPDSGNAAVSESQSLIFYFETVCAAFLDTQECYLTFTFTPTITQTHGANWNLVTWQCALDYNSDAIFREGQLNINGNLTEHLTRLNHFCNLVSDFENGSPYITSIVPKVSTHDNGNHVMNDDSQYDGHNLYPNNIFFGQSDKVPRLGYKFTCAPAADGDTACESIQLAYHIKSFIIGQ